MDKEKLGNFNINKLKCGYRFDLGNGFIGVVTSIFADGFLYNTLNEQGDCIKGEQYHLKSKNMKTAKQQLADLKACKESLNNSIDLTKNTSEPVFISQLVGWEDSIRDSVRSVGKLLPPNKLVKFAKDCALINIELIKPLCTEEKYQLILDFLNNESDDIAAHAAYEAIATVAAGATVHAAVAADIAARSAHAVYYADITVCAAENAAQCAANVSEESREKVNQLLIKLFTKE